MEENITQEDHASMEIIHSATELVRTRKRNADH